ncbi:glycoside hydrolase family 30 protein [Flavihumibacter profundi]|uniref:glycoside hydrolase family 30 protein n=1 Tax=Flavihumibacter profundi TaxID=2716883 RepID=UPI001CC58F05|nr:glycoside hydrolase family 30 beta sandwich domain-containing protein [Flavihumibacter profundi]MBZ5857809.1 glucosylceramidase [Flavihumibacter profundi]
MIKTHRFNWIIICCIGLISIHSECNKISSGSPGVSGSPAKVSTWITKGDQSVLLQKQANDISFAKPANNLPAIEIDSATSFQTIDGFGFALTGGSASLINTLAAPQKAALLQELFGQGDNAIGISYLRISIGASDLDPEVFSYDDLPAGQTDPGLEHFSLNKDRENLVPLLKEIIAINPAIKIMGSPWSPPTWMKDNGQSKGGSLLPQYFETYARYLVKYLQQMKAEGVSIEAITPQNEPLHPGNNPSLLMLEKDQAEFIKTALGPAFKAAGIKTKIIIYDHNLDRPDYPIYILNDPGASQYVDGSAFHLYAGDVSAMSKVHNAHPDKNLYFTEQWSGANESFDGNLFWHTRNVIIGTTRNWSRIALEWNLASDPAYNPHTPGGCTECKGALTIGSGSFKRNASYYIIAHAAKFVPAGSRRIASNLLPGIDNVAFLTPAGKKVLIVVNDRNTEVDFNISFNGLAAPIKLPAAAVATYVW